MAATRAGESNRLVLADSDLDLVAGLVAETDASAMRMRELFISWHGVATLTFDGFTRPLTRLKQRLERTIALIPENAGSRWPKITLGCVRDGYALTLADARCLRRLCDVGNEALRSSPMVLDVTALSIVVFDCRSLERVSLRRTIQLRPTLSTVDDGPSVEQRNEVAAILREFAASRLADYLTQLQRDGGRESHYRAPWRESTLVLGVGTLPVAIDNFCASVDKELPGVYRWFAQDSRHLTIRALVPQSGLSPASGDPTDSD